MLNRRSLLKAAAAAVAVRPAIVRAASTTTLRFIPVIDLAFVDPIYASSAQVSRNHGFMVFDTLYGMNSKLEVSPQMVEGHTTDSDGLLWNLTLREGLLWHDGEKVLARDCVASIRRWARKDAFGDALIQATDELSAPDDRTIRFRLKRPFPYLPYALGKVAVPGCFMMPERLAKTDPLKVIPEVIGSQAKVLDPRGYTCLMRVNHLIPPFNNPAIRRALLGALDQQAFMTAVAGEDPAYHYTPIGFFCPGTPMASDVGLEALKGPRDYDKVKRDLKAAGYSGEKIVLLVPADSVAQKPLGDVAADMLQRAGMNVDYVALDFGTVLKRRTNKGPVAEGGWNAFVGNWQGMDWLTPAGHIPLRGDGSYPGWAMSERIEALRSKWLASSNLAEQQGICADIQKVAFEEVPYFPLGQYKQPTLFRSSITGVMNGTAVFWNVRPV